MRKIRTSDEMIAIDLMRQFLSENTNYVLIDDENITDSPDWVFHLNNTRRIGAELRHLSIERVMKWCNSKRKLEKEKFYEIIIPNEPHFWLKKAIEDKNEKVDEYKSSSQSDEIWLILHTDLSGAAFPFFECNDETIRLLIQAAGSINSNFSRIYFIYKGQNPFELWREGDPKTNFPEIDLLNGKYPTMVNLTCEFVVGKQNISLNYVPENIVEKIILQPLDKRYYF